VGLALLAAAFGLSALAQWALRSGALAAGVAAALAALAAGIAAARLGGEPEGAPATPAPALSWHALRPPRPGLAGCGALALLAVLALQAADRAYAAQLVAWAFAALALAGAYLPRVAAARFALDGEAALVLALVGLGLAARLVRLGEVPGGLYGDEAEFALRALALLEGQSLPPFSVAFDLHPTFFHFVQAGGMLLAGRDVGGLRFASAVAGGLSVLPLYLLLRRELGVGGAAAGALLLAVSPLHVHLTRLGSNNAWVGLCCVSVLAALLAALRSGRAAPAAAAGAFFGLCFYFGNKAIALPAILAAVLLVGGVAGAFPLRRQWRLGALALAVAALVFLPELIHYLRTDWYGPLLSHPLRKLARFGAAVGAGPPVSVADQLSRALLTFLYLPDRSPFMPRPGFPILAAGEATLFLVGIALCLGRPRRPLAALLLGWLAVGLATCALGHNPPQANHLIAIAALPAAGAAVALQRLAASLARAAARPGLAAAAALLLALPVAAQSVHAYFVAGASRWLIAEITAVGRALSELAPTHQLVLVTPPMSWDANSTFRFLARGVRVRDKHVDLDPAAPWFEPTGQDVAFVVDGRRASLVAAIRARYPGAELRERRGPAGELRAVVVLVAREEALRVARSLSAPAARPGSR
jgi:hypothetical protein